MTATTTSYRKTKTGEWVVFGPAALVQVGQVTVIKRDGLSKAETIERVGKTFNADGIRARYGYIAKAAKAAAPQAARASHGHARRGECWECGEYGPVGQTCRSCREGSHA